ncbi:putative transmembrane protein [Thalictrum thalictroides]|uniref:Putative transmembrane protein n=1 Tax=Thalictrum thalictroides TaxID=46969 RepID=A0A7J6X9A8_THATH|nr:putative transmembrane protein [Thalictrum thalictroides]
MALAGRFRQLMKKYGKVGVGVHVSVSAASITGLYVAIRNNVDVQAVFEKVGMSGVSNEDSQSNHPSNEGSQSTETFIEDKLEPDQDLTAKKKKNRTAELAASSNSKLFLGDLRNKGKMTPVSVLKG